MQRINRAERHPNPQMGRQARDPEFRLKLRDAFFVGHLKAAHPLNDGSAGFGFKILVDVPHPEKQRAIPCEFDEVRFCELLLGLLEESPKRAIFGMVIKKTKN